MQNIIDIHKYYIQYILGDMAGLQKAYNRAKTAMEKHPACPNLYLYTVLFEIERGNTKTATNMLDSFKLHANFYKSTEAYVFYIFLLGLLDYQAAKRSKEIISAFKKNYNHYICYMYIHNAPTQAYIFLDKSFESGCRSPFLYLCFLKFFEQGRTYYKSNILLAFLKWANVRGLLTEEMLKINDKIIVNEVKKNVYIFMEIYEKINTPSSWLLIEICKALVDNRDYSRAAYSFYNKLINDQIYQKDFVYALVYSAYINDIENIDRACIEFFLKENDHIPIEIKPFVFHLLLTTPELDAFVDNHDLKEQIIAFAHIGIVSKILPQDRVYYNTIFRYTLEKDTIVEIKTAHSEKLRSTMEESIVEHLFTYKLTVHDKRVSHIWVSEQTKAEPTAYKIDWENEKNGVAYIKIISNSFEVLFFDKDHKNILIQIEQHAELKKCSPDDFWLYRHLYKKRYISTDILIMLSIHYMQDTEQKDPNECVDILGRTLKAKGLSRYFRMQIAQTLGNVLFEMGQINRALEYYKEIDAAHMSPAYTENMLKVFMASEQYTHALNLIQTSFENITKETLQESIEKLLKIQESQKSNRRVFNHDIRKGIANVIYELLIQGHHTETFLQTVLNFYKGSIKKWCALSDSLDSQQITNTQIDEKILNMTIYMCHISTEVFSVFLRMYKQKPKNPIIDQFVHYLCYRIIIDQIRLPKNIIDVLKEIYQKKEDIVLIVSLAILVIDSTEQEDTKILKEAMYNLELSDTFLPIFMEKARDYLTDLQKTLHCITYNADANKEIYIHIKTNGEKRYTKKQMNYFKFGIYTISIPVFYDENISYYFEEKDKKSNTTLYKNENTDIKALVENFELNIPNEFFAINNALIYFEALKHEEMEEMLYHMYRPKETTSYKLL